jgi:uncharacterized protein (DUF1499 family)
MITALSLLGLLLAGAGTAGAQFVYLSPIFGFYLALSGLGLMVLLFFPALLALFRRGVKTPWLALLLGLASAGGLGFGGKLAMDSPLKDLTTDPQNPPKLTHRAFSLPGAEEFLDDSFLIDKSYDPRQGTRQGKHFPELAPLLVRAPAEDVFPLLEKAVREQLPDWKIVKVDPEERRLEIEVESRVFRFIDDVAIESRPAKDPHDSVIEFRSRSRAGTSDLGANASRIETLKVYLKAAVIPAEQADAGRREAIAQEAAAVEAAAKAEEEKKKAEEAEILEAGRRMANPGQEGEE